MKIFQINSVCGTGSTGRIALDLKHFAEQNGVECKIFYGRGFCSEPGCVKIADKADFYRHTALSRLTDRQGFYSKAPTRRLIKAILAEQPDVIHLHNIHGYYLNLPLLFSFLKEYRKPVVWTLHDCWAFTGHCAYFSYAGCNKWQTGCGNCPQKGAYPASKLADSSAKNFAQKKRLFTSLEQVTLVTPSNWLANLTRQSFLKKYPVKVVPNGIDLNAFCPTTGNFVGSLGLCNKKIVLGVANIWEPRKGLPDFLKLADLLPSNYQIVLVGLNAAQCRALPPNVTGVTRTNNVRQLAELYTAAEVYVNLTYEDNYPTTNLEAIACGTPVITYNTGGSPEGVAPGCGTVVSQGDVQAVSACILNNKYNLESFDIQNISKEKCFDEYYKLYIQMMELKE